jgi:uncharacterized protein YceH (UPF0502 family)
MELTFNTIEARIIGALIEKETTTPEYYPLSLNSLRAACNQKSNRSPVMNLDEKTLIRGLDDLRQKGMVFEKTMPGSRTYKYAHRFAEALDLDLPEVAVLCVLLLRGPQTVGEVKSRTARIHEFESSDEVEESLAELMAMDGGPYVVQLPKQTGRREHRYGQLLTGPIDVDEEQVAPTPEPARVAVMEENARIEALEEEVESLRTELTELKAEFQALKREWE